ncbi:hypothetical protein GCWU000341_03002, partial [Oribacterium sp. oral taxon 078 str. F0262]
QPPHEQGAGRRAAGMRMRGGAWREQRSGEAMRNHSKLKPKRHACMGEEARL